MHLPVRACLPLLLALAAVAPPASAASPTQLKRITVDFDAGQLEVDQDEATPTGGAVTLFGRETLMSLMLREMGKAPPEVTVESMLKDLQNGEAPATAPLTLGNTGPAGWACRTDIAPMRVPGVTQALKCFTLVDRQGYLLIVTTNSEGMNDKALAALKAAIASIRPVPAAP